MSALGLGLIAASSYYDENKRLASERRQDQQMELQQKRFGLEQSRADREGKRFEREEKQWGEQDAFKEEQKQWYGQTRRAQIEQESKSALSQWEQENNAYQARVKAGQAPDAIGTAPTKPALPALTQLDVLQDTAGYLDLQARHGKYDPQAWMQLGKAMEDVKQEGTITALKRLQSGDRDGAIQAFNASGNTRITPADVLDYKPVKTKIGSAEVDTYEITYKRPDGSVVRMNAAQQLDSLDKADKLVSRYYQGKQDERADKADALADRTEGRLSLKDSEDRRDKREKRDAAAAYFKQTHPNATETELNAVRSGVIPATPGNKDYKIEGSEVAQVLGRPAVDARGKPAIDPMTGRQITNRDPQREAAFYKFMSDNGITDTNRGLLAFMDAERRQQPAQPAPTQQPGAANRAGWGIRPLN